MNASSDLLERYSRRSLWALLLLLILIGAGAIMAVGFPGVRKLSVLIPMAMAIAAAALKSSAKGADVNPSSPAMKAIINDELRQDSVKRAFRNAFFGVLMAQPLLAFAPELIAIAYPAPMMAVATIWIGMIVMLASVLYYDR